MPVQLLRDSRRQATHKHQNKGFLHRNKYSVKTLVAWWIRRSAYHTRTPLGSALHTLCEPVQLRFSINALFSANTCPEDVCRNPPTPQQAVRLPPPDPNAFKMLTPTASAASAEVRKHRAAEGHADLPAEQVTPEASISVRAGAGGHGPQLVMPSRDPLRSARASPAQLPQGGLNELQKALAKRRGGE